MIDRSEIKGYIRASRDLGPDEEEALTESLYERIGAVTQPPAIVKRGSVFWPVAWAAIAITLLVVGTLDGTDLLDFLENLAGAIIGIALVLIVAVYAVIELMKD